MTRLQNSSQYRQWKETASLGIMVLPRVPPLNPLRDDSVHKPQMRKKITSSFKSKLSVLEKYSHKAFRHVKT